MRTLFAASAVLLVVGVSAAAGRQDQGPGPLTFRSAADLVQVDVSVLDGRREPVTGLSAADFVVLENGRARTIDAFTAIDLPDRVVSGAASWTRDVPLDVATNRAGADEGRIVVILMDRSIPIGQPTIAARRAATAAVESLGPGDLAAVVSTSGGVPQTLTADRTRLLRAVNQRDWSSGSSSESGEILDELAAGTGVSSDVFSPLTDGRCLCGLCVLSTITNVASALERMPRRRKSLLFIGSNLIVQAGPQAAQADLGCGQKIEDARKVMFGALDRSGVTVHAIDPSGLQTVGPTSQAASTVRGDRARGAFAQSVQTLLADQGTLAVLPDRTGGRVVMNTNGPETRVPEIVRESQSYYVLGFRPSEPAVPGETRSIDVRVNRRGVHVTARKQFTVPSSDGESNGTSDLGAALSATLPVAAVPLAMSTGAFARSGEPGGVVTIALDLSSEAPAPPAEGRDVTVAVGVFDAAGRPRAGREETVRVPARSEVPEAALVETVMRLDVPPGDYEVRAAVSAADGGRAASVFGEVSVPSFASLPLSLSHLVMVAGRSTTTLAADEVLTILPIVPTTRRLTRRSDLASVFFRIYQGSGRSDPVGPVRVTASVVDTADVVRIRQVLDLPASAFESTRTSECRIALPVAKLEAGEYLVTVEVALGERVAGRAMRFRVGE